MAIPQAGYVVKSLQGDLFTGEWQASRLSAATDRTSD